MPRPDGSTKPWARPPGPGGAKHRVREGLPLLHFASARATTHDPRVKRAAAAGRAAKRVNKLKKLKARLSAEGKLQPIVPLDDDGHAPSTSLPPPPAGEAAPRPPRPTHRSTFSKAAAAAAADKQAREAAAREAAEAAAARAAARAAAAAERKRKTALLRKRTRSGQPVMKHRIVGLLDKLEREMRSG